MRLPRIETRIRPPDLAAWLLAFDIAELAVLLFFTGGLHNPFAILLLGPVLISATALPPRMTLLLGGFTIACATALVFVHEPLPWATDPPLELPRLLVDVLGYFDGRPTRETLEQIRQERDINVQPSLVRRLVDFGVRLAAD